MLTNNIEYHKRERERERERQREKERVTTEDLKRKLTRKRPFL